MNINKYDWNNKDDYLMGLARKHDQMHQNLHPNHHNYIWIFKLYLHITFSSIPDRIWYLDVNFNRIQDFDHVTDTFFFPPSCWFSKIMKEQTRTKSRHTFLYFFCVLWFIILFYHDSSNRNQYYYYYTLRVRLSQEFNINIYY